MWYDRSYVKTQNPLDAGACFDSSVKNYLGGKYTMNRCSICNDLMSRDQISDTVVLLQCPTCEHEEYELADTADLDTQPIAAIEKDEDTIITRPQPAERCPKCGQLMEDLPPVDEIDDPDWHYFMCTACDTHRAYWWIDGRKVEGR